MSTESRTDTLLSRAVDRSDRPSDWDELDRLALHDPGVVTALWASLRSDCSLRCAIAATGAVAARTALPDAELPQAGGMVSDESDRGQPSRVPVVTSPRQHRAGAWLGWLVACVLAGAWLASASARPVTSPGVGSNAAIDVASTEADQILPDLVLDAQPAADGSGYDLVVVRRALERVHVPEIYGVGADEYGEPVATRVTPAFFTPPSQH